MIKTKRERSGESYERIIEAATLLFAEYGYHGLSTRKLAEAVDLNIATVNYHVGGKQELYQEVFRRAYLKERTLIEQLTGTVSDMQIADPVAFRALLETIAGGLLQHSVAHPEITRLYVRRWLDTHPAILSNYHQDFSIPLYDIVRDLVHRAQAAGTVDIRGLDLGFFLQSFSWMVYGYFLGEPIAFDSPPRDPFLPENVAAFQEYLCTYLAHMLKL